MSLIIAAIQSGTDPKGPLPPGAFHRTLEEQITCPKCSVVYNVVVDYDASMGRFFPEESRVPLLMLRKKIFKGHSYSHTITHLETNGVIVREVGVVDETLKPKPEEPVDGWSYHPRHKR